MTIGQQIKKQTPWEETDEEVARRRKSQTAEPGWTGTIIGLLLAAVAIVALLLTR